MNNVRAIEVLEMLLNGVHPVTGEILPERGPHAEPEVIRALYKAIQVLSRETEQERPDNVRTEMYTKRGKLNAGRPWTEDDDRQLTELYKNQVPVDRMCTILQRRQRGVNNRLYLLGLVQQITDRNGKQIKPGMERMGTQWMAQEDALLREMFNEGKAIEDMMRVFRRSEKGIKYRLERLGLIDIERI